MRSQQLLHHFQSQSGESAIVLASDKGHFHIVKFLQDQGAEWVATRKVSISHRDNML
jgi:hypothetical protein